jgi:hypothetical protein
VSSSRLFLTLTQVELVVARARVADLEQTVAILKHTVDKRDAELERQRRVSEGGQK